MTVKAKVGWEIADGEFIWDINKIFDNNFKLYPGKTDKDGNLYGPSWLHKKERKSLQ